ncbi:Spo0E family sporulation regulatory protein-aspartic acid phosphatase [Paenibacillus koleovorans]|uniref:Spo0E family sporulation regulatory protein-aspartic acid phosphatase n=1 Tax=Paenibacillus koleovorans TaxID=121608 RepID=UPI0035A22FBB
MCELLCEIDLAIREKRRQLNECVDKYGISDPRCLKDSVELDHLINQFNRVKHL